MSKFPTIKQMQDAVLELSYACDCFYNEEFHTFTVVEEVIRDENFKDFEENIIDFKTAYSFWEEVERRKTLEGPEHIVPGFEDLPF